MKKRVLVTGANGEQGAAVINELILQEYRVRAFSTSGKNADFYQNKNIELAIGHYEDAASLKKAFTGIDYVFLSYPVQYDESVALRYCRAFIQAVKESAVKLIVYNTSAWYSDASGGILLHDIRIRIEEEFKAAQLPMIILRPTLYLNNFLGPWSLPTILQKGIMAYPVRASQQIAWTSHEALATITVKAFEQAHLAGQRFDIGNYLLTGPEIAQMFSRVLQQQVKYIFVAPADFEQRLAAQAGGQIARAVADSYRFILENPNHFNKITQPPTGLLPVEIPPVNEWFSLHVPSLKEHF